jgi:radical SAM/Cys-rich protein
MPISISSKFQSSQLESVQFNSAIAKQKIRTLQVNLGKRCNLSCNHCHVEASPQRKEELSPQICDQIIQIIHKFPQLETIDLTGGAPEMNYGFRAIAEAAREQGKEVIVRSNLTIYFVPGYEDLPEYCADLQLRIVASLPCYLSENVDKMRGLGVFDRSISALQKLNQLGYGSNLTLDLVYNSPLPQDNNFRLPPDQVQLEQDYRNFLAKNFGIQFNRLLAIANLPIGRSLHHLQRLKLEHSYINFLAENYNSATLGHLMCRDLLSIDYLGNIYDCDFNQMMELPARERNGNLLSLESLLELNSLEAIAQVQTANYCFGCTAGSGSSCGGSLISN